MYRKRSNPNCNGTRRNKVALKTTCIKKVKFNIIKIRTGCQYIGHFLQRKPKLGRTKPSTGPRVGHSCIGVCFCLSNRVWWLRVRCWEKTSKRNTVLNRVIWSVPRYFKVVTYIASSCHGLVASLLKHIAQCLLLFSDVETEVVVVTWK